MPRGRNRLSRKEDTHDRSPGQPARHSAGFTHLTAAGEYIHAPVRPGMEEAQAGAAPRQSYRDLCRRSRDPVQERQCRRGVATTAQDHGQAEAHGQRGEDTNLQGPGRRVRLPGLHVRTDVLSENRSGAPSLPAIEEEHQAHGSENPRTDGPNGDMARNHKAGGQGEPHAARMGELLPSRHRQQGVSGTRQLRSDAVAPVVAVQAQNQASQGRDLSTPASLRALWARTPEQAWARRAVGEGVKFCPRAGCGKSACPVVCPVKAGMFSRRQTCRGRSQSPVVWIAEVMETETLKPIDKVSPGEATSHRAVIKVNALWPRK